MVNGNESASLNFDIFVSYASTGQQQKKLAELEGKRNIYDKTLSQPLGQEEINYFKKEKEIISQEIYILQKTNQWVNDLIDNLQKDFARKLNDKDIEISLKLLKDNTASVSQGIEEPVINHAVFLVILSDHYLKQESCKQEREFILNIAKQNDAKRRIVLVQQTETDRENWPAEFDDIRVFSIYKKANEDAPALTLGMPEFDPNDTLYFDRLGDLSRYLIECLRYQKGTSLPESKGTIFLAEVSGYLEDRDKFRREMETDGWRVLPDTCYRRSPAALEKSLTEDLNRSDLFVQLLGRYLTQTTEELLKNYEGFELDFADKMGKDILRWLDPNLDLASMEDKPLKALLAQKPYMRMPYEEFKEQVKRKALELVAYRPKQTVKSAYALVDANSKDEDVANNLCIKLNKLGIGYEIICTKDKDYPKDKYSLASSIRNEQYHGAMVVYGECEKDWFKQRIKQYRRILIDEKNQKPVCVIYIGPPPQPPLPDNKVSPINFFPLDPIYTTTETSQLPQFVDAVRKNAENIVRPPEVPPLPFVFLSYCHENFDKAKQLHDELMKARIRVYWDEDDISGGRNWKQEIPKAIKRSNAVVLCLSKELEMRNNSGVYTEIDHAIECYKERPPDSIFLIPIRFSECKTPDYRINSSMKLSDIQHINIYSEISSVQWKKALDKLIKSIRESVNQN